VNTDPNQLWKLEVVLSKELIDLVEEALAENALAVSRYEIADGATWRVEALFPEAPDPQPINALLGSIAPEGFSTEVTISQVPDQDWVGQSLKDLEPVQAGRYFISGRHNADTAPQNAIQILVEAGQAFGTGHHETTRGCLLALQRIGRRRRPQKPLDLGCGTGVLAIAMAKTWQKPVIASDIDPIAARITVENAEINGAAKLVHAITADGMHHPVLRRNRPYDVIVANILAGPLQSLAPAIARNTAAGGFVILSGLLESQERAVAAAFRAQGLARWHRIALNGWMTLVLRDRRRSR
jgi:ribosomal protein L11 methyltransferase